MIQIQKVGEESIPLIRELTYQVWPQTYAPILSASQIEYMLNLTYSEQALRAQIQQLGHQFIIAFENGVPMAFASYSQKENEAGVYRLHKIYLLPYSQGKGIGKKLIQYIQNDIKPGGAEILELNVNRFNPAKSFYEKLGFWVHCEEDIDIGAGYFMNDYVMRMKV